VAIGVNLEGRKDVLGLWTGASEGTKCWLSVLTELRNRGVKDIYLACVDGLKPIYKAMTADEAERQLDEFEAKWPKYPAISRLWRDHWERVIPFFAFPEEVRKIVYTTNAVESLYMSLRKIIKTRGSFSTEEAAFKLLYLALVRVVAKWETVQHWKQMLNYVDTMCGDRISEAGGLR
jgi:putative transposase